MDTLKVCCEYCLKTPRKIEWCDNSCGVMYCKRECKNRDHSFHSLNCRANMKLNNAQFSCDSCGWMVPNSCLCAKCERVFTCHRCSLDGCHSTCSGGFTVAERHRLSSVVASQREQLRDVAPGDLNDIKECIVARVIFNSSDLNTAAVQFYLVALGELRKESNRAIMMKAKQTNKKNMIPVLVIYGDDQGNVLLQQYACVDMNQQRKENMIERLRDLPNVVVLGEGPRGRS